MELLAPAGNMEALIAAVQNGADAVYLGAKRLNARAGAGNFDKDALREAVAYCHDRGVKVHVTVNIMMKDHEDGELTQTAEELALSGADAAIVQDLGAATALRAMLPSLKLHASTQMAIHNPQGAAFARKLGFDRVVLAREASFAEIAACAREGIEIEVFGHGALCVSCSGQCLMSSMIGGRSGNRGKCAQPCRLPYTLSGAVTAEGYLLSPRDLMTLNDLKALRDAGACSLKLEGRLKRPEYVAEVTRVYRKALDRLEAGDFSPAPEADREALLQIFNRGGFTRGYGPGLIDRELMSVEKPNHWGVALGTVAQDLSVTPAKDIDPEDALALRDGAGGEWPIKGLSGPRGARLSLRNQPGAKPGLTLWRLVSEEQMARAQKSMAIETRAAAVSARLTARVGKNAALTVSDGQNEAAAEGEAVQKAENRPFDPEKAKAQLQKTGGTPYIIENVAMDADGDAFMPLSALNGLRREALDKLTARRREAARGCESACAPAGDIPDPDPDAPAGTKLYVQAHEEKYLRLAREEGADGVIFAPEDTRAEGLTRAADIGFPFRLAVPKTLPGAALAALNRWAWDRAAFIEGVILQNPGHFALPWPGTVVAGDDLCIASRRALGVYLPALAEGYMPSIELTGAEIGSLGRGGRREIMVYGRVQLMALRHCPIRAALGGCAHAECRRCDGVRPEDTINGHELVDRTGARLPLRRQAGDGGCVVKIMADRPIMLLRHLKDIPPCAAWHVRLTDEDERTARAVIALHRAALRGEDVRSHPLWGALEGMKSTTGHLKRGVE